MALTSRPGRTARPPARRGPVPGEAVDDRSLHLSAPSPAVLAAGRRRPPRGGVRPGYGASVGPDEFLSHLLVWGLRPARRSRASDAQHHGGAREGGTRAEEEAQVEHLHRGDL